VQTAAHGLFYATLPTDGAVIVSFVRFFDPSASRPF
jgi:hypothetical protein